LSAAAGRKLQDVTFMDTANLTCGVWPLIEYGIRRYIEEHGRKPLALVLHPTQVMQLNGLAENALELLDGVSVVVNPFFGVPVLVNEMADYFEL
jgi:hypothetical protein